MIFTANKVSKQGSKSIQNHGLALFDNMIWLGKGNVITV